MTISIDRVFVGEQPTLEFRLIDQDGTAISLAGLVTTNIDVLLRLDTADSNLYSEAADVNVATIESPDTAGIVTWAWPEPIPSAQVGNIKGMVVVRFAADHIRATEWFNLNVDIGLIP